MNFASLFEVIPEWRTLGDTIAVRFSRDSHGEYDRWQAAVDDLPEITVDSVGLTDTVTIAGAITNEQAVTLETALGELHPWRKGPFELFGVKIDSEWRSDWKWRRVTPHLDPLADRRVLDVGCGNGYFGWRMLEANAALVVGVDPTLVFCMQHQAINRYLENERNWVIPIPFEQLPMAGFDTVFSMGVVYHRREPDKHVQRLFSFTRPGGQLVLESLIVENTESLIPVDRYARMGNVRIVPSIQALTGWVRGAGYVDVEVVDMTSTTVDEQRSTPWMRFDSLREALHPVDPVRTTEGLPAPVRAIVVGRKPK
ncbi:MAG: tRNA 5-methoxyuridine(34)/uridine 5-oxyacetic acid(34) synthase CmoB [Gammaproteobacteria bacterium]|nr:tRNA 5-methoxyuridine(34)/uridine 5-oxyacetic acid(34) synthase CmoB [Gammaproteobacteria bacterium]